MWSKGKKKKSQDLGAIAEGVTVSAKRLMVLKSPPVGNRVKIKSFVSEKEKKIKLGYHFGGIQLSFQVIFSIRALSKQADSWNRDLRKETGLLAQRATVDRA